MHSFSMSISTNAVGLQPGALQRHALAAFCLNLARDCAVARASRWQLSEMGAAGYILSCVLLVSSVVTCHCPLLLLVTERRCAAESASGAEYASGVRYQRGVGWSPPHCESLSKHALCAVSL